MAKIGRRYFRWLIRKIDTPEYPVRNYTHLLNHLHSVFFISMIELDENRESDGIDLRYRFGYEANIDPEDIHQHIDTRPCTVLEMMVALCIRVEEHIMYDNDIGDRTGRWFWDMIESLGLEYEDNDNYNADEVSETISRFIRREYYSNGQGGLVTLPDCPHDLREVEIWYQVQWYLNSIAEER